MFRDAGRIPELAMQPSETPIDTRPERGLLSIGRLAEETGISSHTLRIWERRYGRPRPVRLASGHRRYSLADVGRMRLVARLLALGDRPGELLRLSTRELDARLAAAAPPLPGVVEEWLELAAEFETDRLASEVLEQAAEMPPAPLMDTLLVPALTELNDRRSQALLGLRHLYAAQEAIEDALRTLRMRVDPVPVPGPSVALCSLAGDEQRVPLQMAALLCEANGVQARVLGVDAPVPEVARFTREIEARAVWMHVSRARSQDAPSALRALRDELPPTVEVTASGPGIRARSRGMKGVRRFSGFVGFEQWLRRSQAVGWARA